VRAPSLASAMCLTFSSRMLRPEYEGSTVLLLHAGRVAVPSLLTERRERKRMVSVGAKAS